MAGASGTATLRRGAVVAVAAGLGATLAIAAGGAARAASANGWMAAGWWRLTAADAWDRFLHVLPYAGPAAVALVVALALGIAGARASVTSSFVATTSCGFAVSSSSKAPSSRLIVS